MEAKKVMASIAVGALLLGAGALGGANLFPKTIVEEHVVTETVTVEVPGPTVIEYKDVILEKNVTVEKIVEVDNGNLDAVLQYSEDVLGEDIETEDAVFYVDAVNLGEAFINEEIVNLLDDADQFDDGAALDDFRKSEISIKKISTPKIVSKDFEDKDIVLSYEVKVKAKEGNDDAVYFMYEVTVPFESGKLVSEDAEIELI